MDRTINSAHAVTVAALMVGCAVPPRGAPSVTSRPDEDTPGVELAAPADGGARPAAPAPDDVKSGIECAIEPGKSRFRYGEPILVAVSIRNRSGAAVNAAFWGREKDRPIVNFRISGPRGSTSFASTKQGLWCGTGVRNVPIPEGRQYEVSVDLLKTWEFGGAQVAMLPGDYTVAAELVSGSASGGYPKLAESRQASFTVLADE